MMNRKTILWIMAAALIGTAGLAGSRMAFSEEADTTQLKNDIDKILSNQETILAQLKTIQEEVNVVRIRCSA